MPADAQLLIATSSRRPTVIKKTNGQYHFVLKAANGEAIATSERYTTKDAAKNGIDSVKANASARVDDETGEAASS